MIQPVHEEALPRDEHSRPAGTLVGEANGAVRGFCLGISYYDSVDYNPPGIHDDQEGFYILEGHGVAKVGTAEFAIQPGSSFIAPKGVPHCMKRAPGSEPIKVLYAHGAV